MTNDDKQKTTGFNGIPTELDSQKQTTGSNGAQTGLESQNQRIESTEQPQTENHNLKNQLEPDDPKIDPTSPLTVSIAFAIPGILSLAFSVTTGSSVLAFIGLGLTFWAALFYLVRPITYVQGGLLNTNAAPLYQTIDRITKDLDIRGKAIYLPPYPQKAYLPDHLKGLKETTIFLPKSADQASTPIEEMATGKFTTKNPKGIILNPPGSSYLDEFEKLLRTDITKITLEDLCNALPQVILENYQLAKEIEMKTENNHIHLKTTDSIYKDLYKENLKTVKLLGDPLTSAIACTIAKATGKQVQIEAIITTGDERTIEATYQLIEG
jgi:hypothetical protein